LKEETKRTKVESIGLGCGVKKEARKAWRKKKRKRVFLEGAS
jgi:hypothetical protein